MNIQKKQQIDSWLGYILIAIFLPFTRLLGISLKRNHLLTPTPDTIVFLKLMGLGSLVVSSDMILLIKEKYPEARIILITDTNIGNGIKYFLPEVEIWKLNTNSLFRTFFDSLGLLFKSWQLVNLWVCDLEVYSKLTTIFSLLTCARNRFGFILHPVQFRNYLNTHNVYFNGYKNLKDNYALIGQTLGLTINESISEKTSYLRPKNPELYQIVINNTCSTLSVYRKVPNQTLVKTIKWILKNTDFSVTLVGTLEDFIENESIISSNELSSFNSRLSNLAGKLNFEEYYAFLITKAVLMISIDSAPLHIAKKLGVPTLSIWGPTNPQHYFKVEDHEHRQHSIIYNNLHCSPCVHHTTKLPCGGNNVCMKEITTSEILQKLELLIQEVI